MSTTPTSCGSISTRSRVRVSPTRSGSPTWPGNCWRRLGLRGYPKTSGNRGIPIYVRIRPDYTFEQVRHAAIGFGRGLERRGVGVTTAWWKEERGERIFVDFNQNNRDRTIAGAWSLRARPGRPGQHPDDLGEPRRREGPARVQPDHGPPSTSRTATLGRHGRRGLFAAAPARPLGVLPGGELNFPPDYPKMPGEPPRVQPSKKVAAHWDEHGNRIEK